VPIAPTVASAIRMARKMADRPISSSMASVI
jgi:hypothetical protein